MGLKLRVEVGVIDTLNPLGNWENWSQRDRRFTLVVKEEGSRQHSGFDSTAYTATGRASHFRVFPIGQGHYLSLVVTPGPLVPHGPFIMMEETPH